MLKIIMGLILAQFILLGLSLYQAFAGQYAQASYMLTVVVSIEVVLLRAQVANLRKLIVDWRDEDIDTEGGNDE